jgi:hypothetical protein
MDRVHEAKPAPDEPTGDYKTEDAGGKSNKKLQHIEFPELRWRAVTLRNAWVKDSAVGLLPTCRGCGMRIAGDTLNVSLPKVFQREGANMPRQHPTVQVPNIGPMDHAWDLLGEWQTEFELPETESPVHGKVTFRSWTDAELQLDPIEAAIAGIPSSVPLERASEIHLTDAGGGALQWVLHAPSTNWSLQATLWPGSLHLFVHDADDDEEQLYRARATRDQDYYLRKYPLDTL